MILKLFLYWRLGLFFIVLLASLTVAKAQSVHLGLFTSWAQWDGGHYLTIASSGYKSLEDYAFFPLFPLLIKLIGTLFLGNLILSGLFISHISFIFFLYFFYRLISLRYSKSIAFSTLVTFLVFPSSFFNVALYSESLFLLLSILCLYFLQKKQYFTASIFAVLASLTRFVGIVLAVSIFYSYLASHNFKLKKLNRGFAKILIAPLGFLTYTVYLLITTGDPFRYLTAQVFWKRQLSNPLSTIYKYVWELATLSPRPWFHYLDFATTIIFLLILILGIRKIPSSWWIFSIMVILLPASTSSLVSMSRFVLSSFGAFVILGKFLEEKPRFKIPLWGLSLLIQALLVVRFTSGIWTA